MIKRTRWGEIHHLRIGKLRPCLAAFANGAGQLRSISILLGNPSRLIFAIGLVVTTLLATFFMAPYNASVGATAKTYYVDCSGGNDNNAGTSTSSAWKSIGKANKASLNPGDSLLLKRGCTWSEQLKAKWAGTASQPILIGAYGSGALPKLQNNVNGNIYISGSYQTIQYVQTYNSPSSYGQILSSCDNQPVGWVVGFNFAGGSNNTVQYSQASHEAIGASLTGNADNNHILNNQFIDNDGAWEPPSSKQGLRGGTGIDLTGTGNEIAYNHFEGNITLCPSESISIELYTASNSNIHHNTTYGDTSFIEMGSSSTFKSSNNTLAYNIFTTGAAHSRFLVTRGQGDSFGPVWQTIAFNNVIYGTGSDSQGVVCSDCAANVLTLRNNIIDVVDKALYVGAGQGVTESNDIFWSPNGQVPKFNFVQNWTMSSTSHVEAPLFVDTGSKNFHLQSGSPAINAGSMASVNAGYKKDLEGNAVPQGGAVDIGAYETGSGSTTTTSTQGISVPGRIQAENYNSGGEGVGYHDTTSANLGGADRNDGVDIQRCTDSTTPSGQTCYNVGWPVKGEWMAYSIQVGTAGTYHITARVASAYSGETFHIEIDGKNVTGSISVPNTHGWQTWTNVTSSSFSLSAGAHTLKLVDESNGFNVDYFDVAS